MKFFVAILVLVNIIFFAFMQWGSDLFATQVSVQAQPPIHAEKIMVVNAVLPVSEVAATSEVASAVVAVSKTATIVPNAVSPVVLVAASAPSPSPADAAMCLEWGDFSGTELSRASAALQSLKLGDKVTQRQVEHTIGFWVYVGPLKDKDAVTQKLAQLKARGVEEYFVVQDDPQWNNAISLGVFKTREAAKNFLLSLQAKDVRTAQIGERSSKQKVTQLVLQGLDATTVSKIIALQSKFSSSEVKNIACY